MTHRSPGLQVLMIESQFSWLNFDLF